MIGIRDAAMLGVSCTSTMLSDILRNLVECTLRIPTRANSNWIYEVDTMTSLIRLLACAGESVLYNMYYPHEKPYPNFYIVQNCVGALALLTEAAEQADNAVHNT